MWTNLLQEQPKADWGTVPLRRCNFGGEETVTQLKITFTQTRCILPLSMEYMKDLEWLKL